ncbi:hypothetical protein DY000_02011478 [Brassica cretica]|uniref:Uncharacterized protein n=1 Tax=Brassica cretica TaxID=69181 RepID=A0ABQ7D6U3_BRACR|nr:hypothetical protein DY000_02011478 [Brassica cretica]
MEDEDKIQEVDTWKPRHHPKPLRSDRNNESPSKRQESLLGLRSTENITRTTCLTKLKSCHRARLNRGLRSLTRLVATRDLFMDSISTTQLLQNIVWALEA